MRHRRVRVGSWPGLGRGALARDTAAAAPRPGRAAHLGRRPRPGRARARAAEHHRPLDGRPADRERGREPAHRGERRVLRLRGDPAAAGAGRPPLPHALGQRDRASPVRGRRGALPAPAARRVRLRDLGRAGRRAVRRPRPLRHQAALLRAARGQLPRGLGGEGARGARRPAALGPRDRLRPAPRPDAPAGPLVLRGCAPGAARLLPDQRRDERARGALLGLGLPDGRAHALRPQPARVGEGPGARARARGEAAAARGRAGGLLPQRRPRLVRRARHRLAAVEPAAARLHAVVRPRRLRRARDRRGAGTAVRRRVLRDRRALGAAGRAASPTPHTTRSGRSRTHTWWRSSC